MPSVSAQVSVNARQSQLSVPKHFDVWHLTKLHAVDEDTLTARRRKRGQYRVTGVYGAIANGTPWSPHLGSRGPAATPGFLAWASTSRNPIGLRSVAPPHCS